MGYPEKRFLWAVLYGLLLTSFTLYVVLDTFVIPRVYAVIPSEEEYTAPDPSEAAPFATADYNASDSEPGPTAEPTREHVFTESVVITDNSYSDPNISIIITEYREYDTLIYVADILCSSAEYLHTAFAKNTYGRNVTEKTSEMAEANDAILAINGDYYGARREGYVIRDGVLYRDAAAGENQEDLVIWRDGSFEIIAEGEIAASALLENGAKEVMSFGPALLEEGSLSVTANDEVDQAMASNPRTAIGIVDDLHYLFVVSDGRTSESKGLTLYQLAVFMQNLGADIAYNLDGGGSSAMCFNGKLINNPTSSQNILKERSVSDIVYIGYEGA